MESQKIDEWLEKYWRGETSREEEAQLRRYFDEQEPPPHLRSVAALFQYYAAPPRLDAKFDEQLKPRLREEKAVPMWATLLKIAAVVALFLAGAWWLTQMDGNPTAPAPVAIVSQDTYEDPERAYEEAKQALLLVSSLMNEGTQHLTKLEEFDEAQQAAKPQKSTL